MKTKYLKETKAITLIALIVTIVVLLILAGVSIAVLTGENGILNRATEAKTTNEHKTAEEELKLGVSALSIDYRKNTTNSQTFIEYVTGDSGAKLKTAMGLAADNQDLVVVNATNGVVSYKGQKYQVDDFGGVAEYNFVSVKINIGGTEREITADDDMSLYYGTEVTNYTTGGTYRIFYIDFAEKYGAKGTIYLKADYDGTRTLSLSSYSSYTPADISSTSILAKMNPDWYANRSTATWNENEHCVAYLCDPTTSNNTSNQAWIGYFDSSKANYVIGSPSVELYCDSYEKVQRGSYPFIATSYRATDYPGYVYKKGESQSNLSNSDYETGNDSLNKWRYNKMYAGETYTSWILSSPSSKGGAYLCKVESSIYGARLDVAGLDDTSVFCPIVSLKSTFVPEIVATNN